IAAPPRRVPRGTVTEQSEEEKAWYQTVVDQTESSSLLHRYGTLAEQAAPILFLASDEASYITGTRLPVAGGDLGCASTTCGPLRRRWTRRSGRSPRRS